jgi:hypothetical protein
MRKHVESVGAEPVSPRLNLQPPQKELLEALEALMRWAPQGRTFENDLPLLFEWAAPLHRYWTASLITSGLLVRRDGRIHLHRDNIQALIAELRQE